MAAAPVPQEFVVQGQVFAADGSPLPGLVVVALDRDLRGEQRLGQATTNWDGRYQIQYQATQFARAEKDAADVVIRVMNAAGLPLAASDTLFNAPQAATIYVVVDSAAPGLPSEYERLIAELTPLLVNVVIRGLTNPSTIDRLADLVAEDIDFLTGETGQDRAKLEFLVTAAVLQKQALAAKLSIPAAAFYGLAREGLPLDLAALLTRPVAELQAALTRAVADNIVSNTLKDTLAQLAQNLHQLVVQHALQNAPVAGAHTIGELLAAAALSADQQQTLLSLSINHTGTQEDFWRQLRVQPNFQKPGLVEKLQLTVQLGLITQNHVPLIQQLQTMSIGSTRDLVKLDAAAWLDLVDKEVGGKPIGVPPEVPGATPQDQALNYVNGIVATLQAAFPTDTVALIAANAQGFSAQNTVGRFFANSPDFNIRTMRVDAFVAANTKALNGISEADKPQVLQQVKRLQRIFQLSTNADAVSALLAAGLDSAHAIANTPRKSFLAQYTGALGGDEVAAAIFERAQHINARTLLIFTHINEQLNGVQPAAIGDDTAHVHRDLVKALPDHAALFGSLDLCQCDQCRSVLSPAAYLVDLLEFLRNSTPNANGKTPLYVLLGRRPDLQYLPLTCENTNTAMPYLDLVNEVLESYVALGFKLDQSTAHDTGEATTAELNANPQYTNATAYQQLAQALYPTTLPFNQPIAAARVYLENLGTSRYEVLTAFQKQTTSTARGLAAEYLKIAREEYQVVTGEDFDPTAAVPSHLVSDFYGFSPGAPKYNVPPFLQSMGIAYDDLIQLVETAYLNPAYPQGDALRIFRKIPISFTTLTSLVDANFANPDSTIVAAVTDALGTWQALIDWSNANYQSVSGLMVIDGPDAGCDLSQMELIHLDGTPLSDQQWSKVHRFIRLWRKTGWSIADLDRALVACKATDTTGDVVTRLSQIQQLKSRLNVNDLQILLSLWAPIGTRGDDALYAQLFLNKAASDIDPAFVPQPNGAVLTDTSQTIAGHFPALLAALRMSAADLVAICADASRYPDTSDLSDPDTAKLDLTNVSMLYRYAATAKVLKLRVADFVALKALCGIDPFAAPDQTIQFQTVVAAVTASAFKVAQLTYLYRHLTASPADLSPQPMQLLLLARNLHDGLSQIAQGNLPAPDPTGELSRAKLMVLFDSATAETTIGMINGSAVYTTPLAQLPAGIVFPDAVVSKVSYDATGKMLRFLGAMASAEQAALIGASSDTAYQGAVNDLYQQPATFIQGALSGFLDVNDATSTLVRNVASLDQNLNPVVLDQNGNPTIDPGKAATTTIAEKFAYLLGRLLPYLITRLSHALAKQSIADTLRVDNAVAQVLLETALRSPSDPAQPAITDLLALVSSGLTANYFTSSDLSGKPTVPAGPVSPLMGTAIPAGTQSGRWLGMLLAPNSGTFSFSVQTNATAEVALWVDGTNVPLAADPQTSEWVASTRQALQASQLYDVRLEVSKLPAQAAAVELRWQSAALPKAAVASDSLYPRAQLDAFGAAFTRLQKAALIVNAFDLSAAEVAYLVGNGANFGNFDFNALPLARNDATAHQIDINAAALFESWRRVNDFVRLRNRLPQGEVSLIDVFDAAGVDDATAKLAQVTGWDAQLITALAAPSPDGFGLGAPDFKSEIALVRLDACVALVKRLGVSAMQLFSWAELEPAFTNLQASIVPDIRKAAQAKYDPDAWLTVARSLNDDLRQAQRDALIAYVLPRVNMTDANQLFEYFLIDPQMCACMETSRIKQAISSVQLFVQRCLLNLEQRSDPAEQDASVSPAAIDADQWKWMQQYSLWAPNREIFFYPENWIESSLRDDKSPFFKELESALLQNEITNANVETAFLGYLQKLDQVARLEICGMYWEDTDPGTGKAVNTLHVFGRTRQPPHSYFYRRLLDNSVWTAWEPVTADIQGDHLIPVIWNRRLLLFWPTFTNSADAPQEPPQIDPTKPTPLGQASPYLLIGLAWSEYKQGKWSPKKVTKRNQALVMPDDSATDNPDKHAHYNYVFKAELHPKDQPSVLRIHCYYVGPVIPAKATTNLQRASPSPMGTTPPPSPSPARTIYQFGNFDIGGCAGDSVAVGPVPSEGVTKPVGFDFDAMMLAEAAGSDGLEMVEQDGKTSITYLSFTPSPYELLYPHQYWPLQAPFFYEDKDRTFFAAPSERFVFLDQVANSYAVDVTQFASLVNNSWLPPGSDKTASSRRLVKRSDRAASEPGAASSTRAMDSWTAAVAASGYQWSANTTMRIFGVEETDLAFDTHYHPFVCEFMQALTRQGVPGLLTEANQALGNPYLNSPWKRASLGRAPAISVTATGPACIIQSDFGTGAVENFEAVVLEAGNLTHYSRNNSKSAQPWKRGEVITSKADGPGWLIQSDWQITGHGRLDVVVPEGNRLIHYWCNNAATKPQWKGGEAVSVQSTGPACLIQSAYLGGGHGRFEVVALEGNDLVHYWLDGTQQQKQNPTWQRGEVISTKAASSGCIIQSDFLNNDGRGRFEVVVCESSGPTPFSAPYDLVHYTYNGAQWTARDVITPDATGAACIIQSDIADGPQGNFEVVAPEGNALVHYWRDNANPALPWQQGLVITDKATGPACLIQSSIGKEDGYYGEFEVVALEGNRLVHYCNATNERFLFAQQYGPSQNVDEPYPVEDVDFHYGGAYSLYNWELFFYAPLLIATRLSAHQRFQDAITWFHYIFNPTDDTPHELPPGRYWKVLPFKTVPHERLIDMMMALDAGDADLVNQVDDWRHHPFQPFRLARLRLSAFQKNVFMNYLDTVIRWGDYLFQHNTIETINQAEQLYVLAADLLGPRPQTLSDRGQAAPETYFDLQQKKLDAFSNAMMLLENEFPFSSGVSASQTSQSGGLLGLSKTLYFCIPQNDKLLRYWDTVADRLFKIRNCMNIQGAVQQLPLFEPPIDPALLVQAAAQGVDISSVLDDVNGPLPYYRFSYTLQKALEMSAECRSLGAALLSALEKNDVEAIATLRATQETGIQTLMKQIKSSQLEEAQDQVQALQRSRGASVAAYQHYQLLLTGTVPSVPDIQGSSATDIAMLATPTQPTVLADDGSASRLLPEEQSELDNSHLAREQQEIASSNEETANELAMLPDIEVNMEPFGGGVSITWGMRNIVAALTANANAARDQSAQYSYDASHAGKMAGYFRLGQERTAQSNRAAGEINQINQQILAANIRAAIADYELNTLYPQQLQNAQDVQDFLKNKYTNQELYGWMISDVSATFFQCYQLAYDLAKKAERAFRFERGVTDTNFIQFGYWDSLRNGLQAGERLYLALKQMERAHQDQNKREYEITKRVSLVLLDPFALISLKETGQCIVDLPEQLFDTDYPGHYMRRVRNVSLTIPCVTGPYTSVNCTLTLLKSKIRLDPNPQPDYSEQNTDPRFLYNFAATQSIATSTAQNDSGMFEVNFRDERYLPFEGAGSVSQWRLEMPRENNAFDFETISDVIFNLSYTSRDGGGPLRQAARNALANELPQDALRLFSLKHEFPSEWYRFMRPADAAPSQTMSLNLSTERFPFLYRGKMIAVNKVEFFLVFRDVYDSSKYKLDQTRPTPLGDYAKGTALALELTPPGSPPTPAPAALQSNASLYKGLPHGTIDLANQPGSLGLWKLEAGDAEIQPIAASLRITVTTNGTTHFRLNGDVIEDAIIVAHYSVS